MQEDGDDRHIEAVVEPTRRPHYVRVLPDLPAHPPSVATNHEPHEDQQQAAPALHGSDDFDTSFDDQTLPEEQVEADETVHNGIYATPWRSDLEPVPATSQRRIPPTYDEYLNKRRAQIERVFQLNNESEPIVIPAPPKSKTNSNRCKCIAILILVIILIIIGVAVGLVCYFVLRNENSSSSSGSPITVPLSSTLPTTILTTTPYPMKLNKYTVPLGGFTNTGPFTANELNNYMAANVAQQDLFVGNGLFQSSYTVAFTKAANRLCTSCSIYSVNTVVPSENSINYCCQPTDNNDLCKPFCLLEGKYPFELDIGRSFCGIEASKDGSNLYVCVKSQSAGSCQISFYTGSASVTNEQSHQPGWFTSDPGPCPNIDRIVENSLRGVSTTASYRESSSFAYLRQDTSASSTLFVQHAGSPYSVSGIQASQLLLTTRPINALQITLSNPGRFVSVYVVANNKLTFIRQLSPAFPWESIDVDADGRITLFATDHKNGQLLVEQFQFELPS
ncbi:hypothetical protein QR680_002983 [Steinernema hermaphroditum]|uniref:Uncharacterized protein n=1 Tax=Steinernema hermaphroditum TaxID=289476 RepID=A0AA39H4X5_9BILA|nr:hypothetical protein QR680_002983 [Steinernema hermaphroditum]